MTTDSFFALACTAVIALLFGFTLAFSGYRLFLILLPIFGFFFGFGLGAQSMQALFGEGFLSTISSWLVGFLTAALFAVLSYLFYFCAVTLIGAALGYSLGVGLMLAIGLDFGFIVWLVGIILAIVVGAATLLLNIQKWVIIAATALLGAGIIVGTFLFLFGGLPPAQLVQNPVRHVLQTSPFWLIVFLVIAALGGVAQYQTSRLWRIEAYNRLLEEPDTRPA
jgi:hypothetical protein